MSYTQGILILKYKGNSSIFFSPFVSLFHNIHLLLLLCSVIDNAQEHN